MDHHPFRIMQKILLIHHLSTYIFYYIQFCFIVKYGLFTMYDKITYFNFFDYHNLMVNYNIFISYKYDCAILKKTKRGKIYEINYHQ